MEDFEQVEWMARCCDEDPILYNHILVEVPSEHRHAVMHCRVPGKTRYHDVDMSQIYDTDEVYTESWRARTIEHLESRLREKYGEEMKYHVLRGDIIRLCYPIKDTENCKSLGDPYELGYYDGTKLIYNRYEKYAFGVGEFPLTYWFERKNPSMNPECKGGCCRHTIILSWQREYYVALASNLRARLIQDKTVVYTSTININNKKYHFYLKTNVHNDIRMVYEQLLERNYVKSSPIIKYHARGCEYIKRMTNKCDNEVLELCL